MIYLFTTANKMLVINKKFDMSYTALENKVQIINGRTMLPLREIVESVGYSVGWDAETKSSILTDTNDYTEMNEFMEMIENADPEAYSYEYDPEKPSEELTQEEVDFLTNYFQTLTKLGEAVQAMNLSDDFSNVNTAQIKTAFNAYAKKFSDVECPESLKGLDENTIELFNSLIDKIGILGEIQKDTLDENGEIAMSIAFPMMFIVGMQASIAIQPLTNLCRDKNLDMETIAEDLGFDTDALMID